MLNWPDAEELLPGPRLVAAWDRLEMVPAPRLPLWAAHWLATGHDGQALTELAIAAADDPVTPLLAPALRDCGVSIPDLRQARRMAFAAVAAALAHGAVDEGTVAHEYTEIMIAGDGWTDQDSEPSLIGLFDADDDWDSHHVPRSELAAGIRTISEHWLRHADSGLLYFRHPGRN